MSNDLEWRLEVIDSCPLFAQDLEREITVEWVVERALCDLGSVAISYTRSPDVDRPFTSQAVLATVWAEEDDNDYELIAKMDFLHLGLAKRWCTAQQEITLVTDANEWLAHGGTELEWGDDPD